MPPARGAPKAAQSASALERVGPNGASESLQIFLGGFVANSNSANNNHGSSTASADAQQEALIAQSLRLVQKSSDISKQKALQQIMQSVDALSEASVALYAAAIAEVVIQYANYSNPLIRAMIFGLLRRVGSRDKTVKVQLMSSLPTLCGVWIMAMHDMESAVRQEATAAFEATFSPDKRPVVLQKYAEEIRRCACEAVEKTMKEGKPLKDDALDPRANATYAALRTLGYLIRQVSASQTTLLPYILDQTFLLQLLPPATTAEASTTTKSAMAKKPPPYLAAMTPLVRSAALSLLRDVVSVCPLTPKIHSLIAQALRSTVVEVHASVAARFWELLLLWCKSSVAEVITYLPGGLLDEIVDGMMNCNDPELADIIFPSILPLLTQLSKDSRCDTVVDEFCGALVEKLRSLIDTPNVSARELGVVLTTLLQCWELLCLRRKESSSVDGEELFAVVLYNLSLLMQLEAKQRRFMNVVRRDLSRSLLKTSLRCEPIFQRCLATLCELPDRPFSALPPERDASLARSLRCIMAATLGTLYASAVEEGTYTRQLPQYAQLLNAALDVQCGRPVESDGLEMMEMLLANAGTSFIPAEEVQTKMVEHMLARLDVAEPVVAEDESATAHTTPFRQLALTALSWGNATIRERLQNVQVEVVQRAVRDHFLLDPQTVGNVLIAACRVADFAVIDQSIHALRTSNATLSEEERAEAVLAIASSLEVDLELLGAHPTRCPVVAAMMDDVDEESSDAGSSEEDEESGDDDGDDDDETESEGSSNNSADEQQRSKEKEEEVLHTSTEVASRLQQWIRALQSGHNLCDVLALTPEVVEQRLMPWLTLMIAALAPAVKPDQLLSLKGLRVALMSSSRDALTSAMEAKSAVVKTHDFAVMVEELHAMLQSLRVVPAAEDACSTNVLTAQMEGRLPSCFHAIHALHQLAPLASSEVWRAWMSTPDTWTLWAPSPLDLHRDDPAFLPLFDGVLPISRLRTGLGRNVRTAQCIKLMDHCNMMESEEHIRRNFPGGVAKLLHLLLRVFSAKEMLAEAVERCLLHQLLLPLFLMVKREDAEELLEHLASTDGGSNTCSELHLIITLAATVVELATIVAAAAADDRHESAATAAQHRMAFCLCARRIMSAVVCRAVSELFVPRGALGISVERSTLYANFCSTMDKAATIMKENLLAQLPQEVERLLLEGSCMLTQWDARTSRLTIILHRHLGSMPVVAISTVKSFLPYAQRQPPTVGLELLAELSCTRILDMPVFSELMRIILNSMSQCYTLRHLPSNKRLMEENVDRPSRPLTFDELRTVCTAAILAWRGSVIHSRMDDVLRASVNLLVFDTICEAVSRLRTTTEEEAPLLAKLIATNVGFMEELLTKDVSVFRASEVSVTKIAKVATYAYAWVSATPVQRLEAIGMDVVAGVLRCVNMLSHLTLMNANVASLRGGMRAIMGKCSLRGVRETFSGTPAKLATFRKQQRLITKTQKQRLLLFPYLLAWSIYLSVSTEETEAAHTTTTNSHVELAEEEVLKLLDLLCVLLLSPMYVSSTPRLSDTFLGHCAEVEPRVSERHAAGVLTTSLGFEIIALTRTTSMEVMSELAKGAAAVFAKLLTNRESLPHVRRWLDTVERKLHALFFQMVEHYISPTLVQESLLAVCRHGDGASSFSISDSCSIQVSLAKQQIDLSYEMDDAKSEVRIIFPSAFPLRRPTVDSSNGRGCGVKNDRWRSWMLRMTAMLFSDSANMWQCVELFARNLDAHFEGTEPCPICFAIVSSIGRSLPDLQCATCKNCRLHSACLQRWWSSGAGQSICPLCRAPWIAA